uniref:Uncharacterized protein n=1 Tax=Aegilops tauschii subsp. strangulata TaxID=200361 RepID=A0A453BAJ6_AEGTS
SSVLWSFSTPPPPFFPSLSPLPFQIQQSSSRSPPLPPRCRDVASSPPAPPTPAAAPILSRSNPSPPRPSPPSSRHYTPTSPPAHPWSSRHLSAPPTASTETAVDLRCASWRTAGEANNLAPWADVLQDCVPHVHAYLTGPAYRSDLDLVAGRPPPMPAPPPPPAPGSSTSTRRCSPTSPTTRSTVTGG